MGNLKKNIKSNQDKVFWSLFGHLTKPLKFWTDLLRPLFLHYILSSYGKTYSYNTDKIENIL